MQPNKNEYFVTRQVVGLGDTNNSCTTDRCTGRRLFGTSEASSQTCRYRNTADNSCQSHVARPTRPAGIQRPFGHIILMHAFYFVINLRGAPVSNRQRFIFETRLRGALITGTERSARSGIGICLHSRRVARVAARRPSHRWAWARKLSRSKSLFGKIVRDPELARFGGSGSRAGAGGASRRRRRLADVDRLR